MKKILFISMFLLLFSSCNLYKKYQRPELPVDEHFREGTTDTLSLATLRWRELFQDSLLCRLIDQGLQNNSDLRIAHLRSRQAEASLRSARQAYIPSLTLAPQASFSDPKTVTTPSYQVAVSASWEVDFFGKLTNAKRAAQAAMLESEAYVQAVHTRLVASISASYYSLLLLDAQEAISQQTLIYWNENLTALRALKEAGMTNEAAVAQAEAGMLSVESSLLNLRQQIKEMENSLSSLLGQTSQRIERGSLDGQRFPDQLSTGIPLQLLERRPDLQQAEQVLAQATYATQGARAAFYPSINLGGTAGWTSTLGTAIFNPGSFLLTAVGSLAQPIFQRGLNKAQLQIAKARQEEALISFSQALLNAGVEVNNALSQWQTAGQQKILADRQVEALASAVNSTQLLMKHGSTTYLEVLTAQQSLLQAQLSQSIYRFNEIQGVINLYQALGGGIE